MLWRALPVVVVLTVTAAACGSSGGDNAAVESTTRAPDPVEAEPLPDGATLQLISVKVDSSAGEVRIEYEVQSSKAAEATIALESQAGMVGDMRNFDDEGNRSDMLTLEQGRAQGTAVVDLERGADLVRGSLVRTPHSSWSAGVS